MGGCGSTPAGFQFDPAKFEEQSLPHPDIPACRVSKIPFDAEENARHTAYDVFKTAVEQFGDRQLLGWRSSSEAEFDTWLTYKQVSEKTKNIGYGLRWLKQEPNNETFIGMFSQNRMEVVVTQLACYEHSMVIVPMYDTLGIEGIEHIINQTKMQVIVCENEARVKQLLGLGKEALSEVTTIIHMDTLNEQTIEAVSGQGWMLLSFADIEMKGKENPVELVVCTPESLCLICYTSGTTGKPKGVMVPHNGLYSVVTCLLQNLEQFKDTLEETVHVHLSYLPLAHVYEQMNIVALIKLGGMIGFSSGDRKQLIEDVQHLKPTIFTSVPKIFNRMYDRVIALVSQSSFKQKVLNTSLNKKENYYKRGLITKDTFWDKPLFKRLQNALGGRVQLMTTGGAPISPPVLRFFRLAFGAMVGEGYGQTESSAAICGTLIGDSVAGEVGPPLPVNMVKLVDVPEMDYLAINNIGEICVKGLNVFKGYLYDEEKTRETLDSDGWLHTGDVGMWTQRGTLKIVDRKKNIFKLSQGEYVAPERIENIYLNCGLISQCLVYGDSLMSYIVAIVVPDEETLPDYAKSKLGLDSTDMVELCASDDVKSAIMTGMAKVAKESNLKGFEQVKDIHLLSEPFSVENGLLTATFKVRRQQCLTKYKEVLEDMYAAEREKR
ncbi:long-chain-fatty-acid--CoA ligase 5-like [Watersipora subatra]|uniref:long-chain-fatty-acid--CoA ligase 5-like n=1 Tax=Watersipora subatra TaxID=2589382 RepID=UPI00355B6271